MNTIDFTPLWYWQRRQVHRDRRRRVVYVAAIFALLVGWWTVNRGMLKSAQAAQQAAEQGQLQAQAMRTDLDQLRAERERLQEQLGRFKAMARHMSPNVVFAELSHLLPEQARLDRLALVPVGKQAARGTARSRPGLVAGGVLEQARHSDFKISLVAQARDNAVLLRLCLNLQNSPLFEFSDFGAIESRRIAGGTVEERKIDLYVVGVEHISD